MTKKPRAGGAQPNQSLIDGIAVLQALALASEPVGGRELARRLGFEPTRVNRLLKTLAHLNIARQTANRKYAPGPGMTVLAAQSLFASRFLQIALPELGQLRRFGHTVAMGVLWRDNVSYLYHAKPAMPESDALGRIGLYPATQGGIGLALLAEQDDDAVRAVYDGKSVPGFPDGMPSLIARLEDIRERGHVRVKVKDDPEQHTIAICVGQPTFGAVGVSGWIPNSATDQIVAALRDTATRIETMVKQKQSEPTLPIPLRVSFEDAI